MKTIHEKLDAYHILLNEIHSYFDYREDWRVIPLEDHRSDHWMLIGGEGTGGKCVCSPEPFTKESIEAGSKLYSGSIYTQRHLPKWVYRGTDLTMVAVDTHSDGNKFLMIFSNDRECTDEAMRAEYQRHW